jgi:hypothetical protein
MPDGGTAAAITLAARARRAQAGLAGSEHCARLAEDSRRLTRLAITAPEAHRPQAAS